MTFTSPLNDQQCDILVSWIKNNFSVSHEDAEDILVRARLKFLSNDYGTESDANHTKVHPCLWSCIKSVAIDLLRKRKRQNAIHHTIRLSETEKDDTPQFELVDPVSSYRAEREKKAVYDEENVAREELDRAKIILKPNQAGKDNRYLIWYRVDLYFALRRRSKKLSLPPEIVISDDEKDWQFQKGWPKLIALCQTTYQMIDYIESQKDILDRIVNEIFRLSVSESTWNKWHQRMRDDIRKNLPQNEFPFLWRLFKIPDSFGIGGVLRYVNWGNC